MRIFLSYASQDQEAAKSIYLALRDQGHQVFFDRADLPAGEEYHNRIRQIFQNSHLFIFLISPNAIDSGSYTLTELAIAEKSATKLLPVLLHKTAVDQLPASIKAVTFLETDGSLPGAVAAVPNCPSGVDVRVQEERGASNLAFSISPDFSLQGQRKAR